jgi:glycosyltransferase involved in cell wall biosynthesis
MDVYPDVAILARIIGKNSSLDKILTYLSAISWKKAIAVVVIGRCMADLVVARGVDRKKVFIIPNWANEEVIRPVPPNQNSLRKNLRFQEDFIVLYSGNMGVSHYFRDILDVAYHFRDIDRLKFVFTGYGARRHEILEFKEKYNLDNIFLLPFQPLEHISEILSLGDIHFISLRSGFEGRVVPSKAYSALAAGRPIIYQGNPSGEIARMIIEENVGHVVPINSTSKLSKAIMMYYENPDIVKKQGEKCLALIRGKYNKAKSFESYAGVFKSAIK